MAAVGLPMLIFFSDTVSEFFNQVYVIKLKTWLAWYLLYMTFQAFNNKLESKKY